MIFWFSKSKRNYIQSYDFPLDIIDNLQEEYPDLDKSSILDVIEGLRQYLLICGINRLLWSSMPSKVVDSAWHHFILNTRKYDEFCRHAYGKFLHHSPAKAMKNQKSAQIGIQRVWSQACKLENITPSGPHKIPLIFSLDRTLKIKSGYNYVLNCEMPSFKDLPNHYCAGHMSMSAPSGCGGGGGCGGD